MDDFNFDDIVGASRGRQERVNSLLTQVARSASEIRRVLENSEPDENGLWDSLKSLRGQLKQILQSEDAEMFGEVGDLYDPESHRILETRAPAEENPIVLEVENEGLLVDLEVIQKAEVIVSEKSKN